MSYKVYILYSFKLNRFYVGISYNIAKRLAQHNNEVSPYTSQGSPWTLIWTTSKPTIKDALILERKLKNLSRDRKFKFMLKYKEGIIDLELLMNIISE